MVTIRTSSPESSDIEKAHCHQLSSKPSCSFWPVQRCTAGEGEDRRPRVTRVWVWKIKGMDTKRTSRGGTVGLPSITQQHVSCMFRIQCYSKQAVYQTQETREDISDHFLCFLWNMQMSIQTGVQVDNKGPWVDDAAKFTPTLVTIPMFSYFPFRFHNWILKPKPIHEQNLYLYREVIAIISCDPAFPSWRN